MSLPIIWFPPWGDSPAGFMAGARGWGEQGAKGTVEGGTGIPLQKENEEQNSDEFS